MSISLSGFFLWFVTIALAVLKLCHVISIGWLWVFFPVLVPAVIVVLALLIAGIALLVTSRDKKAKVA
jgi:hypothetical protein